MPRKASVLIYVPVIVIAYLYTFMNCFIDIKGSDLPFLNPSCFFPQMPVYTKARNTAQDKDGETDVTGTVSVTMT